MSDDNNKSDEEAKLQRQELLSALNDCTSKQALDEELTESHSDGESNAAWREEAKRVRTSRHLFQ